MAKKTPKAARKGQETPQGAADNAAPRWTVIAGRQLYFDGRPALSLGREGETAPVEADAAVKFVAEAFNAAGMTLDGLYARQMGYPKAWTAEHAELAAILRARGFIDPESNAARLVREGMGPHELEARAALPPTEIGGLTYTHGIAKIEGAS